MNILGTGSALPTRVVTNDQLSGIVDTNDEWIVSRTGIRERRVMVEETLLSLGAEACAQAIEDAGIPRQSIDYLICSTVQGDTITPALANLIQAELGLCCAALDINAACVGFVYALDLADALVASGKAKNVLVVCSEGMSRMVDWTDRATCVLFGDGAGAVVVGQGDGLMASKLTSTGSLDTLNAYPDYGNCPFTANLRGERKLAMQGQEVFKFAVSSSVRDLGEVMERAGLTPDDIDHFLLHQANKRIIDSVRTRMRQPESKFPMNIHLTGNTSSASVPILLDQVNRQGLIKKGDRIALSAFGAGLVTGAMILTWTKG